LFHFSAGVEESTNGRTTLIKDIRFTEDASQLGFWRGPEGLQWIITAVPGVENLTMVFTTPLDLPEHDRAGIGPTFQKKLPLVQVQAVAVGHRQQSPARQAASYDLMKAEHAEILKNWLTTKPNFRLAEESDYDVAIVDRLRKLEGRTFTPFYARGDFNRDREEDFAVILVSENPSKTFSVAVFNGPFQVNKPQDPVYYKNNLTADDTLIAHGGELIVDHYGTEDGFALTPVGNTYRPAYMGDEEIESQAPRQR
jgi:hypothetical protein